MQCSLASFPDPPLRGNVTVCEMNSQLISAKPMDVEDLHMYTGMSVEYPKIFISKESLRSFMSGESARSAFLEHRETLWRKIVNVWYESGSIGLLQEIANNKGWLPNCVTYAGKSFLALLRWASSVYGSKFAQPALSYSQSHKNSIIRGFAWHPHTEKFAIVCRDDSIRIHSLKANIVPVLKHRMQKEVADIMWKPMCASVLAVACCRCVLVWTVDPTSSSTHPSSSSAQVLQYSGHSPVTSVAWHPQGLLLVSAAADHDAIIVWDVAKEEGIPLKCVGGGGITFIRWSPDSSKLFAATSSSTFRVFETRTWTSEKWSKLPGCCQTACWSADGSVLLICTLDEPTVYYLTFQEPNTDGRYIVGGSETAVAAVDLSEILIDDSGQKLIVGGTAQSMVWDPSGERLAVLFRNNDQEFVAVFRTQVKPVLEIMPCGLLRGEPGDIPQVLQFQQGFQKGALLTLCWSSGKVTFLPMFFVSATSMAQQRLYVAPGAVSNGGLKHRMAMYSTEN